MSISSSAVLARLTLNTWTAEKLDREQTDKVLATNNADSGAGKFSKNLMAGTTLVKEILNHGTAIRHWHEKNTLAWEERGARLLPTSLFMQFKQEANMHKAKRIMLVGELCDKYVMLKGTARISLGSMYREEDYPSVDEIREKYKFTLTFTPVPESGHFVLDIPAKELEETKQSCEVEIQRRLVDAVQGAWDKLYAMLSNMSKKLVEADEDTKRRWHDSFVDNPKELCRLLEHLNVTNDPKLEAARVELERAMLGTDLEGLKYSPVLRASLKSKVDSILASHEW